VKPVFPIEYRLLIAPRYNERERRAVTYVGLRTVTEFSHFRYEVVVNAEVKQGELRLDIHGLRAPELTLPHAGSALFETEIPGLDGTYRVVISKLAREVNTFTVAITADRVTVLSSPENRFVDLVTTPSEW
jgi:hypothetical protein